MGVRNAHTILRRQKLSAQLRRSFKRTLTPLLWRTDTGDVQMQGVWTRTEDGVSVMLLAADLPQDSPVAKAGDFVVYPAANAIARIQSVAGMSGVTWVCMCSPETPIPDASAAPNATHQRYNGDTSITITYLSELRKDEKWVSRYRLGDEAHWRGEHVEDNSHIRTIHSVEPFAVYRIGIRRIGADGRMSDELIMTEVTA